MNEIKSIKKKEKNIDDIVHVTIKFNNLNYLPEVLAWYLRFFLFTHVLYE